MLYHAFVAPFVSRKPNPAEGPVEQVCHYVVRYSGFLNLVLVAANV